MMSSGRFFPLPFNRATMFGRFGSIDSTFAGMPSLSSTCFRYSTAGSSLPGGSLVSKRSRAW